MQKRKCFDCKDFEYITCNYKNKKSGEKESSIYQPSNKFEILARKVINVEISNISE